MEQKGRKSACKSPSQELREVFQQLYKQDSEEFDTFDAYYLSKMTKLVVHYRTKIKAKPLETNEED